MDPNPDYEDLLSALSREHADFLIVGGYAVMKYTEPRYTKDLDVWVGASRANAAKERVGRPQDLLDLQKLLPLRTDKRRVKR